MRSGHRPPHRSIEAPAGNPPAIATRPPTGRAGEWKTAATVASYLGAAVVIYAEVWSSHPSTHMQVGADQISTMWFLSWILFAVLHGHNPFFAGFGNYPFGVNVLINTSVPLLVVARIEGRGLLHRCSGADGLTTVPHLVGRRAAGSPPGGSTSGRTSRASRILDWMARRNGTPSDRARVIQFRATMTSPIRIPTATRRSGEKQEPACDRGACDQGSERRAVAQLG